MFQLRVVVEDNIKIELKQIGCEDVNLIKLTDNRSSG
jgi:hypothetical protein